MNFCRKITAAIIGLCTLVLSIDAGADNDTEPATTPPVAASTVVPAVSTESDSPVAVPRAIHAAVHATPGVSRSVVIDVPGPSATAGAQLAASPDHRQRR